LVSLKRARQVLGELVTAAEQGKSTFITRRGRKAAMLCPVEPTGPRRLPDLSEFRALILNRGKDLSKTVTALREEERH